MIEGGKKAPAFTLESDLGKKVRLVDFAGHWVVIYFYPKDDTPGCTTEACEFTRSIAEFVKIGATVLGVSPDSVASHRAFKVKHQLKITLLSDPNHEVMEKYGAWGEKVLYGKKSIGVIRSTVIVDPQGRIAHHWKRATAKGHAAKVRARLAELQGGSR